MLKIALYSVIALIALALIAGYAGLLSGRRPANLGVKDGRLSPPSKTRNSVSSQARLYADHPQSTYAAIDPLPLKSDDPAASMRALTSVLQHMAGVTLVAQEPDYLHAEAQTRWLKFVDDVEFWINPQSGVIEVRSASRLGKEDLGANRKRVESIRAAYLAQP
jgi:uncharacterized protein (DUF1499 family)